MAIEQLTHDEKKIVFACICAIAKGPFFPPGDCSSRLGIERDALFELIANFSMIDDNDPDSPAARVINNSMNEVCSASAFRLPIGKNGSTSIKTLSGVCSINGASCKAGIRGERAGHPAPTSTACAKMPLSGKDGRDALNALRFKKLLSATAEQRLCASRPALTLLPLIAYKVRDAF